MNSTVEASVTARSKYTNPASGVATVYESLLYPSQVAGPGSVVPVEVQATPGACAPTQEVHGLTVDKTGSGIEICWQPVADPCINGYRILGADAPEAEGNFVPVADVGLVTCHAFDPDASYFLVAGRGAGGIGPTGHSGP